MNGTAPEPRRGEVFRIEGIDWPALVIQNDTGNRYSSTTIVALLTDNSDGPYPFTVPVTAKASGLTGGGFVNLAFIMTVDKSRLTEKVRKLGARRMSSVDEAIRVSLGM